MPLKLNTLNTKLAAKSATYLLNAYTDACIAGEINYYILKDTINGKPNPAKLRAKELTLSKKHTKSYLIGLGFCQYGQNGLMDHLYGYLFLRLIRSPLKKEVADLIQSLIDDLREALKDEVVSVPEYPAANLRLIRPWLPILVGSLKPVERYAGRYLDYSRQISQKQVIQAIIDVQKKNIKNNAVDAQMLLNSSESPNPKIKLLKEAAQEFDQPELFLKVAANTLHSASRWDRWYKNILGFRYRL